MIRVFAYGSNLCIERLRARTPSARVVLVGALGGHSLRWHKKSRDGSGKCDAFATDAGSDVVWGAVYELTRADKIALDRFERLGEDYFEKAVSVRSRDGVVVDAMAYTANPLLLDARQVPYRWYKRFVTTGAAQHALPPAYRRALESVTDKEDPDPARHAREDGGRKRGQTPFGENLYLSRNFR
ncbi:MAG: gamma-glutamylcyclotransferase family protein [Candidatus Binatia bacterium]